MDVKHRVCGDAWGSGRTFEFTVYLDGQPFTEAERKAVFALKGFASRAATVAPSVDVASLRGADSVRDRDRAEALRRRAVEYEQTLRRWLGLPARTEGSDTCDGPAKRAGRGDRPGAAAG